MSATKDKTVPDEKPRRRATLTPQLASARLGMLFNVLKVSTDKSGGITLLYSALRDMLSAHTPKFVANWGTDYCFIGT